MNEGENGLTLFFTINSTLVFGEANLRMNHQFSVINYPASHTGRLFIIKSSKFAPPHFTSNIIIIQKGLYARNHKTNCHPDY